MMMMDCDCHETRYPRLDAYAPAVAAYLLANGVRVELVDADKRTDETVVIWREPADDAPPPDVATLLAEFVPPPPPLSREERIAAATTLAQLKSALLGGG